MGTLTLPRKAASAIDRVTRAKASLTASTAEKGRLDRRAAALLRQLVENYPDAFRAVTPLAVGVHGEIMDATGADPGTVDRSLYLWTRQRAYTVAIRNGGQRVNLDGSPACPVDSQHRTYAARQLMQMKRKK
jgi:sRNA-binding protein